MIYIDKKGKLGWSHLVADDVNELHKFAKIIGLKESWFQAKTDKPHYDVKGMMRIRAIEYGAMEVSSKKIVKILREQFH